MRLKLNPVTFAILLWVALCLFFLSAPGAMGNGVPVKVFLNYLPDVSTWGPETASGEAVLAVGEGWAAVSVRGLPKLQGRSYVAWLIPKQGAAIPIGKFNTDDAGIGDFGIRGLSLPEKSYKLFLITVEPDSDQYQAPGDRRSIAGRLPDPELRGGGPPPVPTTPGTGGSGPDTGTGSSLAQPVPTEPAPVMLPVTGGIVEPGRWAVGLSLLKPYHKWRMAGGAGLALVGLVWFIAFRQGGRS